MYIAIFLMGISTKLMDGFRLRKYDLKEIFYLIVLSLFFLFGLYYATLYPALFAGVFFGLLLANKLDTGFFYILGLLLVIILLFLVYELHPNLLYLVIFTMASYLDEMDFPILQGYRPFLPLIGLIISIISNNYTYFFNILSFDIGYNLISKYKKKLLKHIF